MEPCQQIQVSSHFLRRPFSVDCFSQPFQAIVDRFPQLGRIMLFVCQFNHHRDMSTSLDGGTCLSIRKGVGRQTWAAACRPSPGRLVADSGMSCRCYAEWPHERAEPHLPYVASASLSEYNRRTASERCQGGGWPMLDFQIERLKQLPHRPGETWQGGMVRLAWVGEHSSLTARLNGKTISIWCSLTRRCATWRCRAKT